MLTARTIAGILLALGSSIVLGQTYPNKPIRFVTGSLGSTLDFNARLIGQGVSVSLGQPVVVLNVGGGTRVMETVLNAPADGYTVYITGSIFRPDPAPGENPPDIVRDFSPITLASIAPNLLVVHPSLPVKSVKELIALAKTKPGELNLATGKAGTVTNIAGALFKFTVGIDAVIVPYPGPPQAVNDMLGGHILAGFYNPGSVAPHIKAGKIRALAVTSAEPSALAPGLPTVAASGLPGYEAVSSYAVFAKTGTPAAIINRLNQEMVRVLNQPDVKEKLIDIGVDPVGSSPEVLLSREKDEIARMRKLVKDTGIKIE